MLDIASKGLKSFKITHFTVIMNISSYVIWLQAGVKGNY